MSKKTNKKSKASFKRGTKQLLKAARRLLKFGMSIIPVNKKHKSPLVPKWKQFQNKPPKSRELKKWFAGATKQTCIAVVCGEVSGDVEVLDFDAGGKLFKSWKNIIKKHEPKLFKRLVIEKTQSKGYHAVYACPKIVIPPSEKLAVLKIKVDHGGDHEYEGKQYKARKIDGKYFILPDHLLDTRSLEMILQSYQR